MPQSADRQPNLNATDFHPGVEEAIAHLRSLTQRDVQAEWYESAQDGLPEQVTQPQHWATWAPVALNARRHVAWEKGRQVRWLGLKLQIPEALAAYPLVGLTLRLALTWWAESAQIFVDGQLVQEGDLFDCSARIVLREAVQPGEVIAVALRLVSPGHDAGALVRSICLYERPNHSLEPCPEPGFVADELAVVHRYTETFAPQALADLDAVVRSLDWSGVCDRDQFDRELVGLRDRLLPFSAAIKQRRITLLGHAHLDLAWLWPVSETWDAAERTFKSVLQLQSEFPELIFSHSSPALYAWLEVNRPDLFEAIRQQVAADRWEVAAGLWVEPEFNVISGESLARQILYGQRYVEQKFGRVSAIAWLPDSFGFCWQLPQLLRQGGVRYFVTQKLRWNDTNPFPHEAFVWQAPDGTPIFSLHSAPIGEGVDPIKMVDYACTWEQKTGLPEALWLMGVGDHGGGPSRDMLHLARRWGRSPFFPQLTFDPAEAFLDRAQAALQPEKLPLWNDELYLEYHRGCYTTHADQKAWNTQCEVSLYEAELWAAIATYLNRQPFPQAELETAWKQVLFNQFHDILPGSAITQVYEDANPEWAAAAATASRIQQEALGAIAHHITLPDPPHPEARPVVVFNGLNWIRSEVVTVELPVTGEDWQVWDLEGRAVASHLQSRSDKLHLSFHANAVPGVGYRAFWLVPCSRGAETRPYGFPPTLTLENQSLRVRVDATTGFLASVFDKRQGREMLSGPGNELQVFQDKGQYWDAWNIDPAYEQHRLPAPQLIELGDVCQTAIDSSIRAVWRLGQSQIEQRYRLPIQSAVLHIDTEVDWQETHVLLKAAFPIAVESNQFTREMPFGAITHPTQPTTPEEKAKWEVPALRWVDMSDDQGGVSLLTGYKHGVDVKPGHLRLSLLRSPVFPNPVADRGGHRFGYAIAPHPGSWQTAQIVQRAYELNQPLLALVQEITSPVSPNLPPTHTLFNLSPENLILSALKPSEDNPHHWILRCYEGSGNAVDAVTAQWAIPSEPEEATPQLLVLQPVTLLESPAEETAGGQSPATLHSWQVQTFQFEPPSP